MQSRLIGIHLYRLFFNSIIFQSVEAKDAGVSIPANVFVGEDSPSDFKSQLNNLTVGIESDSAPSLPVDIGKGAKDQARRPICRHLARKTATSP